MSALGVNYQAYYPARELSKLGHWVVWFCPTGDAGGNYALPENLGANVEFDELTPYPFLVWNPVVHLAHSVARRFAALNAVADAIDLFRFPGKFIPQLVSHIGRSSLDVLHAMPFPFSHCWFAAKAAGKHSVPFVVSPYFNIGSPDYYKPRLLEIIRRADAVHVTTEAERLEMLRLGASSSRLYLIPNAVDLSEWEAADGRRFRSSTGVGSKNVILYAGRKEARKGAILALEAARKIVSRRPDTVFIAAGHPTPEWEAALEGGDNVRILDLPYQSGAARLDMFAAADVVVLPSRFDASPTVFLEAWAVGKPVVGVHSRAAEDYICDKEDGLLALPEDPQSLAQVISTLLDDAELRARMGANGRKRVEKYHDWRLVRHQYVRMYENSISNSSRNA